jgi:hypothetical protein
MESKLASVETINRLPDGPSESFLLGDLKEFLNNRLGFLGRVASDAHYYVEPERFNPDRWTDLFTKTFRYDGSGNKSRIVHYPSLSLRPSTLTMKIFQQ